MFKTPHKTGNINSKSGYTMIEALVAIAIFSIGFMAVGAMQINSLNKTNSARGITETMALVQDRVAQLRAMPFYADDNGINDEGDASPTDYYDIPPNLDATKNNLHVDDVAGPYTVRWTIQDNVPLPAYPNDVKADWQGNGLTRSKTIRVWATPDNNAALVLAQVEFAKFME